MTRRAHGFIWPDSMPVCNMCGRKANDGVHVNPNPVNNKLRPPSGSVVIVQQAKDLSNSPMPMQSHPYQSSVPMLASSVPCQACGQALNNGIHTAGLPQGLPASSNSGLAGAGSRSMAASTTEPVVNDSSQQVQTAFVGQFNGKLVLAAPATTEFGEDDLPRQVAAAWRQMSTANPTNLWITGRYVEAGRPNRNAAYWSTEDLEIGQPTVTHGPINWLHQEKHIIGAVAASELVTTTREVALETGVGNHIVALGAIWKYIHPEESRLVQRASEEGKLWYSMECWSEGVSCLTCERQMSYADYMRNPGTHCAHMRDGMPRRFDQPTFAGGAVILPPERPAWANADARVLMPQAQAAAERQAASFVGLSSSDAELLVAQLIYSTL